MSRIDVAIWIDLLDIEPRGERPADEHAWNRAKVVESHAQLDAMEETAGA